VLCAVAALAASSLAVAINAVYSNGVAWFTAALTMALLLRRRRYVAA